ncbi:Aminoglycoside phosphotransferase [Novosphingobium resinovorum]|uniref:Aminoglycoside phosphotransferase n=1 Tax=Novosphingobium resinovorum TaxID=158500 RepID=A0A031JQY4_9SPHN|nr:phosphotransferase family protein [Novosphingobium resinovorum]EZP79304.1 Aminoglycoside phosphotransferase [Novosphingobium resinovorum]
MRLPDKDRPEPAFIDFIRNTYPCEPEVDRVLTRKMERRSGPGYAPVSLATLVECAGTFLASQIDGAFTVHEARWLSGGASKLQMAFLLKWNRPGVGLEDTKLVLRMEPAESVNETSRLRESQLLREFQGVVPAPEMFWVDPEGAYFPYPALICGFVEGVSKPTTSSSVVTGVGTHFSSEWRGKLGPQFVGCLAQIHSHPIDPARLTAFEVPEPGTQSCIRALNMWERVWEEDVDEDVPLMRLAAAWLRENAPSCPKPVILHSDYRVGNFLFRESDAKISAILDWEGGRIGDPHHDLAWASARDFGHFDESGKTFLVGGLITEEDFFGSYEQLTGTSVCPKTLHYYRIFTGYVQGIITLATAYRIARNGKTHQDIVQTLLLGLGPSLMEDLRSLLERGA